MKYKVGSVILSVERCETKTVSNVNGLLAKDDDLS